MIRHQNSRSYQKWISIPSVHTSFKVWKKRFTSLCILEGLYILIIDILLGDHPLVNGDAGDLHPAPKKNIIPKMKICWWVYTKRADWGLTTNKLNNHQKPRKISHCNLAALWYFEELCPNPFLLLELRKKCWIKSFFQSAQG